MPTDYPSMHSSGTALPSDELFEAPPALEKEPTTHTTQVGDGDKENNFVTATSATKEPALAVEVLMDSDYFETHEDGDLSTVVLVDKGKDVDLQEYGGAPYNPLKAMMVPASTTSTGGSDFTELVGIHRDNRKSVDPEERGMAKYKLGPSQLNFHYHGEMSFQKQGIPIGSKFEPTKTTNLNHDGLRYNLVLSRPRWHPKISPYRFIVFSIPLSIGTVKAILSLKGSVTAPITLEWISGIVIFLM